MPSFVETGHDRANAHNACDNDHLDIADVERRIKAIFIGSIGNLVEWYDFYAYTAFALYFAPAFFPQQRSRSSSSSTPPCCSPRPS